MSLPPGPRRRYPGEFVLAFMRQPLSFLQRLAREHGDVSMFMLGGERMVLLTDEGEVHRRQRRLAQPAFHRQRVAAYGDVMAAYAIRARDRWHAGETIDVGQEMMRLTLAVVGKTLFDADVE